MAVQADDINLLRAIARRPRILLAVCLVAIALPVAGAIPTGEPGAFLAWICSGDGALPGSMGTGGILAMWLGMTFAMMLPAALPMVSAYADISDAARAKAIAIVPIFVLLLGYMTVWAAFSFAMGLLQATAAAKLVALPETRLASAALFLAAGLYQFAPLKHACLTKCRQPMPFFLQRWTDRHAGVYVMGLEQGALCLGCCWALMTLMFAAGAMNVAWMAGLATVMLLEKTLADPRPLSYGVGAGLVAAGLAAFATG